MLTRRAGSYCLYCFDRWWDICGPYTCLGSLITWTSTLIGTSTWTAGSFCLCCFWQVVRHLWSVHVSGIPCHTDLNPGRNIYPTSWFILSVFFLTGGEMSVVPAHVWDPPSHRPPPWKECQPDQLVHSVYVFFDRREDICDPYMCLGSALSQTSTPGGTSPQLAGSFRLYCFWKQLICLRSLFMSGTPHHTDLHPSRNVFLMCWFILTVLFLTGGEMSVVPTHDQDPPSHRPPP